ncbi:phage tail length tape measure family protein, partial [Asaia bogorensis]|uniref:phage tail length tape measure family protein n=1 Tax=Asaia bogorensis TaxID=91915 RepID=UPI0013C45347
MMPTTISELYIAFASNLAKAQEDAESLTRLGDAAEVADTKVTRLGRSGASVARQFDETTRAEAKLSSEIRQRTANIEALQKSLAAGEITQEQYAGSLAGIAKSAAAQKEKFDAATGASRQHAVALAEDAQAAKLSSYQIGILAGGAHKFADQVLAGGGAMKAAFYQVPNVVPVMGGFGKATQIVTGLLMGPAGLALAAVAAGAAIYKMGSAANTEESHLAALGQTLRATRSDYAAMAGAAEDAARRIAGKSGLSLNDSRAVTTTFAAMPSTSGSSLDALATTARNLATVLGKDVPDAAKDMAAAFDDPAKAAEDFAQKGLLGVHEGLVQHIRDLQNSGDRMGAWFLLMGQVNKATANAADQGVTPLHRALHDMSTSLHEGLAPLGQFVDGIGNGIMAGALKGVQGIQYLLDKAKEVRDWEWAQLDKIPAVHSYLQQREVAASDVAGVSKTIDKVGASLGASSDVLALAHRIQLIESATGQYDASGKAVQSSAGALGAMQVMPGSANGNDLRTTTGNVTAGVQLLMRLYTKYDGNQALVAMAYNWGEGNVDQYLSGKIASPPASVAAYAQKATGGEIYGAQAIASRQGRVDDQLRGSDGSTAAQIREHEQAITALTTAQKALNDLHTAGKVSDADYAAQTGVLTDKINVQRGALNELRDPIETIAHQQKLAAQSAETYSAAEAAMVQVHQQVEEAARRMGQAHATATQLAEAEARQQAILTGQFNQSVAAINEHTQAEQDMLAGYDASKGSLTQYQQAMEAAEKVRATSIGNTAEQARQLDILTGAMKSATASQVDMANAGKLYGQSQDLEVIKAQTAAIGQNSDAVSVQIAVMKERNRILEAGGDINSKTSQAYLDNVAAIQMATNAYQHQKSALDDLTGSLSGMFDTLTNSVTQAFVQSGKGAVDFGSILSGLQTQIVGLVAKMALINPALNALDGGSRNTFTSVSDALASGGSVGNKAASVSISGAGSTASGVTSSTGWLSGAMGTKLFGTATIGNTLAGIGGGFGIGSALGNIGGGTYGAIGSGLGAALGAGLGSIIPGVGTLIGGIAGGGLGGLLGGLFGHKKNPYTIDKVVMEGDQLSMGQSWNQAQNDTITAQLKADMASVNATMKSLGLKAENLYLGTVRDDPNNKDPSQRSVSLTDLLGKLQLR